MKMRLNLCYRETRAIAKACLLRLSGLASLQVDKLRPDQAAPRWLSLCSPRPGKKRIGALSHTRAPMRSGASLYWRDLNHSRHRQSDHTNHKAFASTEASKALGRVGFGLTHRKDFSFLVCPSGEGGALHTPRLAS